jgi:hypothetical protein
MKRAGGRAHDVEPGQTSGRKESVAISQHQLLVALLRQAAPPDIYAEQKIVLSMPSRPFGSCGVAKAGERSRHEGESRQRPLDHIDVWRAIRQWLERLYRLEPLAGNN